MVSRVQVGGLLNSLKLLLLLCCAGLSGTWFWLRAATLVGFTPVYLAGLLVAARLGFLPD